MRIIVIDVVGNGIGRVPVVRPNIWSVSTKHQLKKKEIAMKFTDINGLDLTYYVNDFPICPSEQTEYLMNDENIATE